MRRRMLGWLGCVALAAPGGAQPFDLAAFDRAVAAADAPAAAKLYGDYYDRTLTKAGPPADPLLDQLAGRFALHLGDPLSADAFLKKRPPAALTLRSARLARAHAALALGRYAEAERLFGQIDAGTPPALDALTGAAHAALMTRPTEVPRLLATPDAQRSWRAQLLLALAASLAGDTTGARRHADLAATLVPETRLTEFAALQTNVLRAALAAAANDRLALAAALSAVPTYDGDAREVAGDVANRVPRCGVDGVTTDDSITLALLKPSEAAVAVPTPVAVSRPAVLTAFTSALAGYWRTGTPATLAAGTVLRLRCSRTPAAAIDADAVDRTLLKWFADRNLRPRFLAMQSTASDDSLTAAGQVLERMEQRLGTGQAALIPYLTELSVMSTAAAAKQAIPPSSAMNAYEQADRALRAADAPLPPPFDRTRDPSVALRTVIAGAQPAQAVAGAAIVLADENTPPGPTLAALDALLARRDLPSDDRRVAALAASRVSLLHRAERGAEAARLARSAGYDADACQAQVQSPRLSEAGVTDADYPRDLATAEVAGTTILEIDVAANSATVTARPLVEAPPLAFDPALAVTVPRMRYDAARDGSGRMIACRALRQSIRWKLPTGNEQPAPFIAGPMS